ncbi:hypothetical protein QH639_19570 [Lysinibacillus sp. 1 U-2021]|uniref:hypothetical protein n=1 Tax=Lysinibacillus sp. 1 U-2021 TaxID=3039426 RepID=UPI002481957B|nr:hypothetical protein [Lysinibacillus sp. 1 U-2021]WGT38002.1 hypothetical protein QH639_19570 [Lysinibacillus sp. 1 U-2021]
MIILLTPTLYQVKPFPPTEDVDFSFSYTGGDQAVRNNLVIYRLTDNKKVYDQTIDSFSLKHKLPTNTLVSGVAYKCQLRVGNINNQFSQFSNWVFFWVLENPVITIDNIDYANYNRVYNQTVTFSATYTHSNDEKLQSFRYILYDNNKSLISSFSEGFSDGAYPLTQEITGLTNEVDYYIEVRTISQNQQEYSTGLIKFTPFYITPKLTSAITVENLSIEGAVKVHANIIQIIAKLYDNFGNEIVRNNVQYVDDDKIDLNRLDYGKLVIDEGFKIENDDFVLKLWCENIPDDKVFLTLYSNFGKIELIKYNDKIHAFSHVYNVRHPAHFVSNELVVLPNQQFMIYMKSQYQLLDLKILLT